MNVRQGELVVRVRDVGRFGERGIEFIAEGRGLTLGPATLDDGTRLVIGELLNLGRGTFQVRGVVVREER